jgi:hypothetical protein
LFLIGALLSACGGGFQPPAAVVNGHRISQAELQGQLDARLQDPGFRAQVSAPGGDQVERDLTRRLLAFLIERQLIGDYAGGHGIAVSSSEVDDRLRQVVSQTGGQAAFDQQLRAQHTTVGQVRESAELELFVEKIEARLALGGTNATQGQRSQAFLDWLRAQLLRAQVQVNPRFGRFDVTNLQVVAITSTEG